MLFMYVCLNTASVCAPVRTWARQWKGETAEVNITCNQQMTTQKMEGAEIEGLGWCGGGRGERRSTNMIIASIFAFFYFCLCPDARNHRQSIPDSPPFFMLPCFAVFLICAGFSLPEFQPNFVPHNEKQHILYLMVFVGNICSQFTVHM